LKHEALESGHIVTHNKGNGRSDNGVPGVHKTVQIKRNGTKMNCFFFCKKVGHMKKDYLKYKKWLEKKVNFTFTCFESNFIEAPGNTWWIGLGSTIQIANNVQGFLNLQNPVGSE